MTTRTLLLVDDDDTFRSRLARALRERSFEVREAADAETAIRLAEQDSPEFAVVDLKMRGASGLAAIERLHRADATTRIVMLTGYGSIATAVEAVRNGAIDYLSKPADADQIVSALLKNEHKHEGGAERSESVNVTTPSLARVEWEHIQRVLSDAGGNISQAARVLGIHRRSLQRKLEKYPVSR
jgi:two-component system, response regulator RegA